jgi:hypothetical protein
MLLLPPGSALLIGPLDLTTQLLPKQDALLPEHSLKTVLQGIGSWLSPVHFQGHQPRRVSCYAFFKRVAASKPTSPLFWDYDAFLFIT